MCELAGADFNLDNDTAIRRTNDVVITENIDFAGLLLKKHVLTGLKRAGFQRPSPIQLKAIPLGRCGLDLIVQAKSGTGKTCVFSVIALESVEFGGPGIMQAPQALVLAPTREVAVQIQQVITSLASDMPKLACHAFIGGLPLADDRHKLRCCHIAVGTPGRIKQLLDEGILSANSIRLFILDEADKLLEEGFQETINWIHSSLPENKQVLALSATYPEALAQHLKAYMHNPTFVRLNQSDPALLGIRQYYQATLFHPQPQKAFDSKVSYLFQLLSSVNFHQCLVFSNYQIRAENLSELLNSRGWPAAYISGSREQHDRLHVMDKLKKLHCRVLVSTDLTARGIDAEHVNLVVNLDVPRDHETYLHRIGRAGRYGTYGAAVSFVCAGQELNELRSVEQNCGTKILQLPDPIPEDLARSSGFVNIDHLVTTEQIITETTSYCTQNHLKDSDPQQDIAQDVSLTNVDDITENKMAIACSMHENKEIAEICSSDSSSQNKMAENTVDDAEPVAKSCSSVMIDSDMANNNRRNEIAKHNTDPCVVSYPNGDTMYDKASLVLETANSNNPGYPAATNSSISYVELVNDYEQYIAEADQRIAKPGGNTIVLTSHVDTSSEYIQTVSDLLSSLAVSNHKACLSVSHKEYDVNAATRTSGEDTSVPADCCVESKTASGEKKEMFESDTFINGRQFAESALNESQFVNSYDDENVQTSGHLSNASDDFTTSSQQCNAHQATGDSKCHSESDPESESDSESEDIRDYHSSYCNETESDVDASYSRQCPRCWHYERAKYYSDSQDHGYTLGRDYAWNQMQYVYMQHLFYYNWQLHQQYCQYYATMYRHNQQNCQWQRHFINQRGYIRHMTTASRKQYRKN